MEKINYAELTRNLNEKREVITERRKYDFLKKLYKIRPFISLIGEYKGSHIKTLFKCNICGFEFYDCPANVIRKKHKDKPCSKCIKEEQRKKQEEKFLRIMQEKFPEYEVLSEYKGNLKKIKLRCKIDGNVWYSTPHNLMRKDRRGGCRICGFKKTHSSIRRDLEEVICKAKEIHGDKYDCSLISEYKNNRIKYPIKCNQCNNIFYKSFDALIIAKSGCPYCANRSFDVDKPAILYYLKIKHKDKIYYKIGITNKTIRERFSKNDLQKIEILEIWNFEKGIDALKKEQEILSQFKKYRYKGKEKIIENGNTELFIIDVLNLDK